MGDNTATEKCVNCKRDIAAGNFLMHSFHCQKNIILCTKCGEPVAKTEVEQHHIDFHSDVRCDDCAAHMERQFLEAHKTNDCPKRKVSCQFCELSCVAFALEEHESYCGSRTEKCDGCQQYVQIRFQQVHVAAGHKPIDANGDVIEKTPDVRDAPANEFYQPGRFIDEDAAVVFDRLMASAMNEREMAYLEGLMGGALPDEESPQFRRASMFLRQLEQPADRSINTSDNEYLNRTLDGLDEEDTREFTRPVEASVGRPVMENIDMKSPAYNVAGRESVSPSSDLVPCEFCNKLILFYRLIEHQTGCRPDLISSMAVDREPTSRGLVNSASPGEHFFDAADDIIGLVPGDGAVNAFPTRRNRFSPRTVMASSPVDPFPHSIRPGGLRARRNSPLVSDLIPCEVCGQLVHFEDLILHESGCLNELACESEGRRAAMTPPPIVSTNAHQVRDYSAQYSDDEDNEIREIFGQQLPNGLPMTNNDGIRPIGTPASGDFAPIPCEICGEVYPADLVFDHQSICRLEFGANRPQQPAQHATDTDRVPEAYREMLEVYDPEDQEAWLAEIKNTPKERRDSPGSLAVRRSVSSSPVEQARGRPSSNRSSCRSGRQSPSPSPRNQTQSAPYGGLLGSLGVVAGLVPPLLEAYQRSASPPSTIPSSAHSSSRNSAGSAGGCAYNMSQMIGPMVSAAMQNPQMMQTLARGIGDFMQPVQQAIVDPETTLRRTQSMRASPTLGTSPRNRDGARSPNLGLSRTDGTRDGGRKSPGDSGRDSGGRGCSGGSCRR